MQDVGFTGKQNNLSFTQSLCGYFLTAVELRACALHHGGVTDSDPISDETSGKPGITPKPPGPNGMI